MSNPFFSFVNRFLSGAKAKANDVNARFDEVALAFDGVNTALSDKASTTHNHDGTYAPVGSYALASHNHDSTYSALAHTHTFATLTSKPTTIAGYGITDFNSLGDARWAQIGHSHSYLPLTGGNLTANGAVLEFSQASAGSGELYLSFYTSSTQRFYYGVTPNGATFYIARCDSGGSYADLALDIDRATGDAHFGANVTADGTITGSSDARLKKNVSTIEGALALVRRMRGVRFERIDRNDGPQVGVIAQEMATVLPEVVLEDEDTTMLSVAYGNLVGVLIEAIKEQQAQIDELRAVVKGEG